MKQEIVKPQTEQIPQSAGTAPDLFVINLCASMTPMPAVPKNLKGFEKYKLYQVSRQEDGRRRFRLRLGFFISEADAEWVLNSVRSLYPAAFTGCVTQEDMRYTNDMEMPAVRVVQTSLASAAPQAAAPAVSPPAAQPVAPTQAIAASTAKPAAPSNVTAPAKHATPDTPTVKPAIAAAIAKPVVAAPITLTAEPVAAKPQPEAQANNQPFHVGRGIQLPETNLELTDEQPILKPQNRPELPVVNTAAHAHPNAPINIAPAEPVMSASIINPPKVLDDYVPILDTTLTIRTLTRTEAEDSNRPKWFAVQLALSEQPINLDTMPKLDIFAAYRLYSVASMENGGIRHSLRLGFFRETVSAEAVMGYLKAFFGTPTISQVSTAEYERFAEPKAKAQPTPAVEAKVVKLNDKRPTTPVAAAAATPSPRPVNTVSKAVTGTRTEKKESKPRSAPPARPQSFLSRLIGRQLD
ncbi:MAG: hypothetical protein QM808_16900 [Steroidobacteraceae bacterium]